MNKWHNPGPNMRWCPTCRQYRASQECEITPTPPDTPPPWTYDEMTLYPRCIYCGTVCRAPTFTEMEAEVSDIFIFPKGYESWQTWLKGLTR